MNNELFKNKYRIPSARAYWHDYNEGCYFITICTNKREHYFGKIKDNKMNLTELGLEATTLLNGIDSKYTDASILSSVVMPNHIHFVISIRHHKKDNEQHTIINKNTDKNKMMSLIAKKRGRLSVIISKFKLSLTKYAIRNDIPFGWQERFYDSIIHNHNEFVNVDNYIKNNISNWRDDEYYSMQHS